MAVPPKRNHRGGLVGRGAGLETRAAWLPIRRPRRRRAPLRRRLTAHPPSVRRVPLLSRRLRRDAEVGDNARCGDDAPARRGNANRIGAAHQSDFVISRTPPRHPPRDPPKSRQRRSQRRVAERFDASRSGVARVLTKASVQLACHSRACQPADTCAGAPRERGAVFATRPIGSSVRARSPGPCGVTAAPPTA
jgi:hypothetical protein